MYFKVYKKIVSKYIFKIFNFKLVQVASKIIDVKCIHTGSPETRHGHVLLFPLLLKSERYSIKLPSIIWSVYNPSQLIIIDSKDFSIIPLGISNLSSKSSWEVGILVQKWSSSKFLNHMISMGILYMWEYNSIIYTSIIRFSGLGVASYRYLMEWVKSLCLLWGLELEYWILIRIDIYVHVIYNFKRNWNLKPLESL